MWELLQEKKKVKGKEQRKKGCPSEKKLNLNPQDPGNSNITNMKQDSTELEGKIRCSICKIYGAEVTDIWRAAMEIRG